MFDLWSADYRLDMRTLALRWWAASTVFASANGLRLVVRMWFLYAEYSRTGALAGHLVLLAAVGNLNRATWHHLGRANGCEAPIPTTHGGPCPLGYCRCSWQGLWHGSLLAVVGHLCHAAHLFYHGPIKNRLRAGLGGIQSLPLLSRREG